MRTKLLAVLLLALCSTALAETPQDKTSRIMKTTEVTMTETKITMEKAIKRLSDDVGVKIEIMVDDLASKGITKNQSISIDSKDAPAESVLLDILEKTDPEGRLAFVFEDDGSIVVQTL